MTDFVIVAVLAVIIAMAARYLYKAKKSGAVCVGCPSGGCSCCHSQASSDAADSGCGCCSGTKS